MVFFFLVLFLFFTVSSIGIFYTKIELKGIKEFIVEICIQVSKLERCFKELNTLNTTSSSSLNVSFLCSISMSTLPVARNGHPKMIGISSSSSMSRIIKSVGNMNLSTLIRTSSTIPLGYVMDRFASCKEIVVGFGSCIPNWLKIDKGIRLMLAPKSQRAFSKCDSMMVQGIVKLLGSLSFGGSFLKTMAKHSSLRANVSKSANFFLLLKISFKNFAYLGI